MRNVRILAAGTLAFSLMIGVAYGEETVNGPQFTLKTTQRANVQPNENIVVKVGLDQAPGVAAFQFQVEVKGGKVLSITMDTQDPTYPFKTPAINAADVKGYRGGGALITNAVDVVSAHIATVTIEPEENASKVLVSLSKKKDQTFLRKHDASALNVAKYADPLVFHIGENVPVRKRATSTR